MRIVTVSEIDFRFKKFADGCKPFTVAETVTWKVMDKINHRIGNIC